MDFCTRNFFLLILLTLSFSSYAQIESGKVGTKQPKVEKVKTKKEPTQVDFKQVESQIYLSGFYGLSDRTLSENTSVFGKPLGQRSNETSILSGGFDFGIRMKISDQFRLSFGMNYSTYGEQNSVSIQDSTFNYTNKYSYLGLPISLQYVVGSKWRFISGIGLQPHLFLRGNQENEAISPSGVSTKNSFKYRDEMNFFTLHGFAQLGVEYQFSPQTSIYIVPEYRIQFTNSYGKQEPYIHKANWFGARLGLMFNL